MGADYKDLARKMERSEIVKAVCGNYVIYRRDWLQEHIEQEYILQKIVKDFQPIKDSVARFKEFVKQQNI